MYRDILNKLKIKKFLVFLSPPPTPYSRRGDYEKGLRPLPRIFKKAVNYSSQKGYTLLEIVISVMIFAIITMGLSLPMSNSLSLTVNNKNTNITNNLARSYLKDVEAAWSIQADFDAGKLVGVTAVYTNNGAYVVTATSQTVSTDSKGVVVIRRVNIIYKDNKGNILTDINYDYNRPGNL